MKNYTTSKPMFSESIEIVETTDPAHADNVNAAPKQLLQNTLDNRKLIMEQQRTIEKNCTQSTEYTDLKIAELINGAPETMDTLKEIADAMEENQDVVEILNEAIGNKANGQEFESHRKNTNIHVTIEEKQMISEIQKYQKRESVEGCIFGTLETGELQEILGDSLCFTGNDVLGSSITTKLEANGNAESYTLKWTVGTKRVKVSNLSGTEVEVPVICMYKCNMYCYDVCEVLRRIVGEEISSIRVQSGTQVHIEIMDNSRGEIVNLIRKIGHTTLGFGDGSLTGAIKELASFKKTVRTLEKTDLYDDFVEMVWVNRIEKKAGIVNLIFSFRFKKELDSGQTLNLVKVPKGFETDTTYDKIYCTHVGTKVKVTNIMDGTLRIEALNNNITQYSVLQIHEVYFTDGLIEVEAPI